MRIRFLLILLSVSFMVGLLAAPAFAEEENKLAAPLGDIEWGDDKDEVLDKLKKQMLDRLRKRDDLRRDRVRLQKERKKVLDKHRTIKDSYERLNHDSGYKVSIIADEFTPGNGESLMRVKDRVASRYYFFVDGGLYKFAVAYNQDYLKDVEFESFVVQAAKRYGRPEATAYSEVDDALMVARWMNNDTVLRVENERAFFGTFKMVFAERMTLERMNALEETLTASEGGDEGVSDEVERLKDGPIADRNADVVDGLVGDFEVELNAGRPKDDQVRYNQEVAVEQASGEASSKTKAAKPKKKAKKKKKKKRDFSDLEASSGGGDDLIIY